MSEKEKFYYLQALVCEKLPRYCVELTVRAGYGAELGEAIAKRLTNVKQGKVISLPDLVALVRHSLPDFEIPDHLLPEPQSEPVTA